jgi:Ubiquitin family
MTAYLHVWNLGSNDDSYTSLGKLRLPLHSSDTVQDVAARFKEQTALTMHQLKYRGNRLHDSDKLWPFLPDLEDDSAPRFTIYSTKTPPLYVESSYNGRDTKIAVPYCSTDTVKQLKRKIKSQAGVSTRRQQLAFADACMDDDCCALSAYGIQRGGTVQLTRTKQLNIAHSSAPFLLQVDFGRSDTVADVKAKIQKEIGVYRETRS